MAPSIVETVTPVADIVQKKVASKDSAEESVTTAAVYNEHKQQLHSTLSKAPLKLSGILDQFESFDVTPVIGKEFPNANLADWLNAPNSEELIRDLAISSLTLHILPLFSLDFTSLNSR